ncbi:GAF domain-containing protein [Ensifer sp. 2YAB10]|uniref:GAF domain-containing protein n=1 Tax=unclassified Ensifer TaxID=2633371 RepID=UPI003F938A8D
MNDDASLSLAAHEEFERSSAWLTGQMEAFQAAVNGAPLSASLDILIALALRQVAGIAHCAFYIANTDGTELNYVTGMPDAFAGGVNGFKLGPSALAHGLPIDFGKPLITPDVENEPRWKPWLWLARESGYRGCWSFPVETAASKVVGTFAMFFAEPRQATADDLAVAENLTHTASMIIAHHQSRQQISAELEDSERLQAISLELIKDGRPEAVYETILDGAVGIMRSQFASLQMLHADRGPGGALNLLSHRGFSDEAAQFWQWVRLGSGCTCARALHTGKRVIVSDVEAAEFMRGTADLVAYRQAGIRAIQTTPLYSRGGAIIGMLSTHWEQVHEPTERELRLLDVVARQAADLIEREKAEMALRASEERLRTAVEVGGLGLWDWNVLTGDVHWSSEHFRMLGYGVDEVTPSYENWSARIHPDDRAETEALLERAQAMRSEFVTEFRTKHPDGAVRWLQGRGRFFYDQTGQAVRMVGAMTDTTERREWENRQKVLVAELQHRTRNLMAVVRAIAETTARRARDLPDFYAHFHSRLSALARVQGLLSRLTDQQRVAFDELIRAELAAVDADMGRVRLEGPAGVKLRSSTAQTLAMALHELATNAVRYGALGQAGATLSVRWRIDAGQDQKLWLHFDWHEYGVRMPPAAEAGAGTGHGRELIERALPYQLQARSSFTLAPDGLRCTISMPVSELNMAR